ncbi:MAG: glucose-6-phosphate isomerase [Gemmatimonadaceae bacterium]|nr:glucose-6-phosphate isomerase [Gemmatimonadaceae bacterium]NUQ93920.1 glucose-6-phosphate isomerase [Gemmatimonadaceae bacterium]
MSVTIDFSNMIARGDADADARAAIPETAWAAAGRDFARVLEVFTRQRGHGVLGFLDLPTDAALVKQSTEFVAATRGRYHDVVVLGIGGSALGPIALRTALRPSGWNSLPDIARGDWPRLHVLDNVDPVTILALLERLELARTLFIVISKSGGTAETMAQYLVVRQRLEQALGSEKAKEALVFVTDPEKGALRPLARSEGIRALDIPANVGGRFSVLTPVGILPAALMGIDVGHLLAGAEDMRRRCESTELAKNPAGVFAMLQFLADTTLGKHVQVLMPYSDPLRDFAAWFVQLWAESLGKARKSDGAHVGPTPLAALGATDQHSQVQLFMEGPADKTVTFVAVKEGGADVEIPKRHQDVSELAYLGGHRLGELLDIERRATAGALARRGRPNMTITLDRVDPWHVGGLIMLLEIATIYAGALYDVNPLDQPGVELGKQFTYAMLGRADAERARQEWNMLPKADPRWSV